MSELEIRVAFAQAIHAAMGEDYFDTKEIPGKGKCGIAMQVYTVGLFCGIDEEGNYSGRYCYHSLLDAREALKEWDGLTSDPPGEWIVAKGFPGGDRKRVKSEYDVI